MKSITLVLLSLSLISCVSAPPADPRPTLVQTKRPDPVSTIPLKKGKFLDYIYLIQPDHKQEGYEISTDTLSHGYAHATGPYDGVFYQFFLFRGKNKDLVFKQTTGYEIDSKKALYGSVFEAFTFENGQMSAVDLADALPLKQIEGVFAQQLEKIRKDESKKSWAFYQLLRMPEMGTDIDLKVCRDKPEPPFSTDTVCATVARLKWNKSSFVIWETNKFPMSDEQI